MFIFKPNTMRFRYGLSLTITFLGNLNFIRPDDVLTDISLESLNMTNILTSKIEAVVTGDNVTFSFYNESQNFEKDDVLVDFSTMYPDKAEELYKIAEKKSSMAEIDLKKEALRSNRYKPPDEPYWWNPVLMTKSIDLMTQSVYATRYRLQETKTLRSKMHKFPQYESALKYGALMQLRLKMTNIYTTLKTLDPHQVKYLWYLVLYERCLAMSTDIEQMVKELIETHHAFDQMLNT